MSRLTAVASGFVAFVLAGRVASAESQAELAAKLNDEGKAHMYAKQYAEASEKFRQAVARVPEPKYFYNLCTSRFQEGKFGEALTACNAVGDNGASPELKAKADTLALKVKDEAKAQGIDLQPGGGGASPGETPTVCQANPQDPSCAQPQTPPPEICTTNPQDPSCQQARPPMGPSAPAAVGRPPSVDLLAGSKPDNKYTWTLGVDLFAGGGQIGQSGAYGTVSGGIRFKGDYMLQPRARLGSQFYLQVTHLGQGDTDAFDSTTLDIIDVGAALYKHFCLANTERLCLTPLGGVELALMSPASEMSSTGEQVFNYTAVGIRLELAAQIAFGTRFEHVLSVAVGTNGYTKVLSGPSDVTPMDVGLDTGGFAGYLGVGYTYRFNTPFGSSPFVTLQ